MMFTNSALIRLFLFHFHISLIVFIIHQAYSYVNISSFITNSNHHVIYSRVAKAEFPIVELIIVKYLTAELLKAEFKIDRN